MVGDEGGSGDVLCFVDAGECWSFVGGGDFGRRFDLILQSRVEGGAVGDGHGEVVGGAVGLGTCRMYRGKVVELKWWEGSHGCHGRVGTHGCRGWGTVGRGRGSPSRSVDFVVCLRRRVRREGRTGWWFLLVCRVLFHFC